MMMVYDEAMNQPAAGQGEEVSEQPEMAGLVGEFATDDDLLRALRAAQAEGYRKIDAYAPFFIEELAETLGRGRRNWLAWLLLGGLCAGGLGGLGMILYSRLIAYPLNIGGRPMLSWPAFIPILMILSILTAALAVVVGFLVLTRLPRAVQPIFNLSHFSMARQDRYFLFIDVADPAFDPDETRQFFARMAAREVSEVER